MNIAMSNCRNQKKFYSNQILSRKKNFYIENFIPRCYVTLIITKTFDNVLSLIENEFNPSNLHRQMSCTSCFSVPFHPRFGGTHIGNNRNGKQMFGSQQDPNAGFLALRNENSSFIVKLVKLGLSREHLSFSGTQLLG